MFREKFPVHRISRLLPEEHPPDLQGRLGAHLFPALLRIKGIVGRQDQIHRGILLLPKPDDRVIRSRGLIGQDIQPGAADFARP